MSESEFTALLDRFEKGECSREEKQLLEEWINTMEINRKSGTSPFTDEASRLALKHKLHSSIRKSAGLSGGEAAPKKAKTRHLYIQRVLKVAASVLLLALAGYFGWKTYNYTIDAQYALTEITTVDGIQKVILSDGSIVWLKTNSSLTYPKTFPEEGNREVTVHGEALFEVEKNPLRPFVVNTGDVSTTVLGTSFNIKTVGQLTEVVVLTGKVMVTAKLTNKQVELLPRESAIYAHADQDLTKVEEQTELPVEKLIAGTEYNMNFDNTTVNAVAGKIAGKFDMEVKVEGSVGQCLITADFTDQSLSSTLEMIAEALNAEYEVIGKKVILKGDGCD